MRKASCSTAVAASGHSAQAATRKAAGSTGRRTTTRVVYGAVVPFGVATTLLSLGDWHNGWRYFEKRWFAPGLQALWRDTGAPPWRGEPLAGKSIALIAEQGLGDMIQFFRFVEPVRALARTSSRESLNVPTVFGPVAIVQSSRCDPGP